MIYAIAVGGALAMSLATVLALGTAMEFERRWRALMVPALYLLILVNNCAAPLFSGRDLLSPDGLAEPSGVGKWFTRLIILSTLTICVARMVAAAFSGENRGARGGLLFAAFCVYFLTSAVLTSALGTHPEFKHDQYYVPFLFAAVYASRAQDPELALRFAKVGLFVFLLASCLVSLVAPELTIEKLVGVYRVLLPRLIGAYTYHLNATSSITDAPTMRSLRFALQDEMDDWREGEMLLQSLISTPEEVDRAANRQRELEQLVLAAGGIAGPGSIGTGEEAGAEASEGVAVG